MIKFPVATYPQPAKLSAMQEQTTKLIYSCPS